MLLKYVLFGRIVMEVTFIVGWLCNDKERIF